MPFFVRHRLGRYKGGYEGGQAAAPMDDSIRLLEGLKDSGEQSLRGRGGAVHI